MDSTEQKKKGGLRKRCNRSGKKKGIRKNYYWIKGMKRELLFFLFVLIVVNVGCEREI